MYHRNSRGQFTKRHRARNQPRDPKGRFTTPEKEIGQLVLPAIVVLIAVWAVAQL